LRARNIHTSMTGNANFQTPSPSLTDLNAAITAFEASVDAADGGSRQEIAVKNQNKEILINVLHLLGNYVLFTSVNNEVVATSSGYKVGKQPLPAPPLTKPEQPVLVNGLNRGELELSCKAVKGAKSYVHEITATPVTTASVWKPITATRSKFMFTGLESGKEYGCRVAAIGVRQQMVYSDVVTRIAV